MPIPKLREPAEQLKVYKDAEAIARLLNRRSIHLNDVGDMEGGRCAIFSAMHNRFASDGNSRWKIYKGRLVALLNWDSGYKVITAEVEFSDRDDKWVAKSTWKRSDVL